MLLPASELPFQRKKLKTNSFKITLADKGALDTIAQGFRSYSLASKQVLWPLMGKDISDWFVYFLSVAGARDLDKLIERRTASDNGVIIDKDELLNLVNNHNLPVPEKFNAALLTRGEEGTLTKFAKRLELSVEEWKLVFTDIDKDDSKLINGGLTGANKTNAKNALFQAIQKNILGDLNVMFHPQIVKGLGWLIDAINLFFQTEPNEENVQEVLDALFLSDGFKLTKNLRAERFLHQAQDYAMTILELAFSEDMMPWLLKNDQGFYSSILCQSMMLLRFYWTYDRIGGVYYDRTKAIIERSKGNVTELTFWLSCLWEVYYVLRLWSKEKPRHYKAFGIGFGAYSEPPADKWWKSIYPVTDMDLICWSWSVLKTLKSIVPPMSRQ